MFTKYEELVITLREYLQAIEKKGGKIDEQAFNTNLNAILTAFYTYDDRYADFGTQPWRTLFYLCPNGICGFLDECTCKENINNSEEETKNNVS